MERANKPKQDKSNSRNDEPGLEDEGVFDVIKPYKQAALRNSDLDETSKTALDTVLPDSFFDLVNTTPKGISARSMGDVVKFPKQKKLSVLESLIESGHSREEAEALVKKWAKDSARRETKQSNDKLEKEFLDGIYNDFWNTTSDKTWPYKTFPQGTGKDGLRIAEPMDWETYARKVEEGTKRGVMEAFPKGLEGSERQLEQYRLFTALARAADQGDITKAINEELKSGKYKSIKNRQAVKNRMQQWYQRIRRTLDKGGSNNMSPADWEWNPGDE